MRYSDLIRNKVIDLITMLDAEGINTVSIDVLSRELNKMGHDADRGTLTKLLDDLPIVDNIKDDVIYFFQGEDDAKKPDPEKQDNKIDKLARKQVKKELNK